MGEKGVRNKVCEERNTKRGLKTRIVSKPEVAAQTQRRNIVQKEPNSKGGRVNLLHYDYIVDIYRISKHIYMIYG